MFKSNRLLSLISALLTMLVVAVLHTASVHGAPTAALTVANVAFPDVNCFFDDECTLSVSDTVTSISLPTANGSGFLQARRAPRASAEMPAAGLIPYLYRVDMADMVGTTAQPCITELALDFGPVVPLDYDEDGSAEHVFVVTSGTPSGIAPSAVTQTGDTITITFSPPICSGNSPGNGDNSLFVGMASPFRETDTDATAKSQLDDTLSLTTKTPAYESDPTLRVVPPRGQAGDTVTLIGTGYTPGEYLGTVLWDDSDSATFDIPSGGAFSIAYTVPGPAPTSAETHTIATCSLNPCATGEFEQKASAPFELLPNSAEGDLQLYLPAVMALGGGKAPEPFSYGVSGEVRPSQDSLPPLEAGQPPRPLGAVEAPNGGTSSFVVNELVVQTSSQAALNALLARVGGEVVMTVDPDPSVIELEPIYLVRATLTTAETDTLTENINSLMPSEIESAGRFRFSDEDSVRIFSLAAEEASDGMTVGINWVSETGGVPLDSREAPNGGTLGGIVYTPDAYDWPHFARGTEQDIGVPEAWNLLANAGRLGNRVNIALLDGGFFPNADFPTNTRFISVIPFTGDGRNVNGVDGGAPFHGTDVLQTASAVGDNNFGIVGVAEPIANPIALYTSYDFFVSIASVTTARAAGARVLNMSYSADVPSVFAWTVLPFEAATVAVRASGALLFASAGNDGRNVDGENCFIFCWEHTWHTPCENAGVICVGGLGWDSKMRAGGSNFGPEHVDIFAPYTVYSGQAPDAMGGGATAGFISGTSFSSPYTASVAALIWAANPSLSAGQVWEILRTTAHTSPDSRVNRYVNAYGAVLRAVGTGVDVEMITPTDGASYDLGRPVQLLGRVGYVAESDGTPLTVQWRRGDGSLIAETTYNPGAGEHVMLPESYLRDLGVGSHTVTLRATAGAASAETSATFTIVNTPPTATIEQPAHTSSFCSGQTVTFRGSSFDPNEIGGLPESAFRWLSNVDGEIGIGSAVSTSSLSQGFHTITLRVTDNQGASEQASINITILSPTSPECSNLPPDVTITSPNHNDVIYVTDNDGQWYADVTLQALVDDAEDPNSSLTLAWFSSVEGSLGSGSFNTGTGQASNTVRLHASGCGTSHTITLRVTDTDANVTEDEIDVLIAVLC